MTTCNLSMEIANVILAIFILLESVWHVLLKIQDALIVPIAKLALYYLSIHLISSVILVIRVKIIFRQIIYVSYARFLIVLFVQA
jgi:hypothetical protein